MKKITKLLALAAIFVLCLSLTACGGSAELNLSDYLSISYSGADGNGTAMLHFDASQMELDYAGVEDGFPTQKQLEKMLELAPFEFSIRWELDKSEHLKNGDKITATITYGKEVAKEANVNVGSTTKTFTVEGLQEPILLDPFASDIFEINGQDECFYNDGAVHIVWERESMNKNTYEVSAQGYYNREGFEYVTLSFADSTDNYSGNHHDGDTVTVIAAMSDKGIQKGYALANSAYTFQIKVTQWPAVCPDAPLSAEDLSILKDEAYKYIQQRADGYNGYGSYVREDGLSCYAGGIDDIQCESVYSAEDVYGNMKLIIVAKIHVTEEYVELVGSNDADRTAYVYATTYGITKTEGQPITVEFMEGGHDQGALTKEGVLEVLGQQFTLHEFH